MTIGLRNSRQAVMVVGRVLPILRFSSRNVDRRCMISTRRCDLVMMIRPHRGTVIVAHPPGRIYIISLVALPCLAFQCPFVIRIECRDLYASSCTVFITVFLSFSLQVLQFGRIDNGCFILDFQAPFSPIQAFATALANLV